MKEIKQLLSQIKTITTSYERLNEASGGGFNIFSVLRIETDEVRTHSRFIAELLNPLGNHGFEDEFLKLFIKKMNIKTKLDTRACKVFIEYHIGKIDKNYLTGGAIDILIKEENSDENLIMIENKIYAGEQTNQLLRYHNAYPKGELFFLTLKGSDSKQETSKKTNYIPISYQDDIINWLEKCKEKSVDNPILRETISQYITLLKKITNQNLNKKMSEELTLLFAENKDNYEALLSMMELKNSLKDYAVKNVVIPELKELKKEYEELYPESLFEIVEDELINGSGRYMKLLSFQNKNLKEKNLKVLFQFQQNNFNGLIGGFVKDGDKKHEIDINFSEQFKQYFDVKVKRSDYWPFYFEYWHFMHWTNNMHDLKNVIYGRSEVDSFKGDLKLKIDKMLELINN